MLLRESVLLSHAALRLSEVRLRSVCLRIIILLRGLRRAEVRLRGLLPEIWLCLRLRSEVRLSVLLSKARLIGWLVLLRKSALWLCPHARLCGVRLWSFEIALSAVVLLSVPSVTLFGGEAFVPSARLCGELVVLFPYAWIVLPSARGSCFVLLFVRRFHVRYLVVVVGAQIR